MQIGFFCPHSDPLAELGEPDAGGQCLYEAKVATALVAAEKNSVHCFSRIGTEKKQRETITPGAEVYRYAMGPEGFLRKEDMGPYLGEFFHHVMADQNSWLAQADIFHGHYWDGGVSALAASLAHGKPLAFTSHSLGALKQVRLPDNSIYRYDVRIPAERRVMQAADGIIALSSVEEAAIVQRYGINKEKIHIVPGGVDVESFSPEADKADYKQALGISSDLMVFTVGRLDARKGFSELLQALPDVIREVEGQGRSITMMMPSGPDDASGSEAELIQHLWETSESLGVQGHIRWFSHLSDEELQRCYAAADVFVCPSLYEPFGLVLVEAMAAATPVVATCHGGPVDIVDEGIDGYLADPRDAIRLAARLLDILLSDETRRANMGKAAREKAQNRYAWPAVARQIEAVYASLIKS
ncbi:MAG: glycosyltransferase [Mariprofundaceae bacterium]